MPRFSKFRNGRNITLQKFIPGCRQIVGPTEEAEVFYRHNASNSRHMGEKKGKIGLAGLDRCNFCRSYLVALRMFPAPSPARGINLAPTSRKGVDCVRIELGGKKPSSEE